MRGTKKSVLEKCLCPAFTGAYPTLFNLQSTVLVILQDYSPYLAAYGL